MADERDINSPDEKADKAHKVSSPLMTTFGT
jgi:hypothetical protein